jgi:hypothetical protein
MITIAVGIVLAVLFLCALPFLILGFLAFGWIALLGYGLVLLADAYQASSGAPELVLPLAILVASALWCWIAMSAWDDYHAFQRRYGGRS